MCSYETFMRFYNTMYTTYEQINSWSDVRCISVHFMCLDNQLIPIYVRNLQEKKIWLEKKQKKVHILQICKLKWDEKAPSNR